MSSTLGTTFRKAAGCPSSQSLLAYCRGIPHRGRNSESTVRIEAHLAVCDFCAAELQLLGRLVTGPEEYMFVEMPAPLRNLAEFSLKRQTREPSYDPASPVQALLRLAS